MKGRKPLPYELKPSDRRFLNEIVADGQQIQRVANRARALLALARGERIVDIVHWIGLSRMGLWHLWQRYQERGVEAIFDEERDGRPPALSPFGAHPDRTDRLYRAGRVWPTVDTLGLSQPGPSSR